MADASPAPLRPTIREFVDTTPLTHGVYEARTLAKAAKEARVATQMGNQGHSMEGIRSVCEWIWDGAIGEIRDVDAWGLVAEEKRDLQPYFGPRSRRN